MVTSLGADTTFLPSLDPRLTSTNAAYSYDATAALILAYEAAAVPNARREDVLRELPKVSFAGVTGPVSFNSYGDRVGSSVTIVTQKGGEWAPTDVIKVDAP